MAVVWEVVVDSIPARLEMNLSAETVLAIGLIHHWRFWHWRSSKTGEADTVTNGSRVLISQRGVVRASESVTGEHSEAWWKGFQISSDVSTTFVIDGHSSVGDFLEGAIGMLVVQERSPVR